MTVDPVTVGPEMSLRELARVLHSHGITGAPVVEGGEVVGIVSGTDIVRLTCRERSDPELFATGHGLDDYCVHDIMTAHVHAVEPGTDLDTLAHLFATRQVRRALVFERDSLVGIVSVSDLLGALAIAHHQR
jgi:CBS domain-containing protein